MRKFLFTTAMIAVLGCLPAAPARAGDNTLLGTLGGAALGGFVGHQFGHGAGRSVGTGVGVLVGGLVGNHVGRSMDYASRPYYSTRGNTSYSPYPAYAYSYYEPLYVAPPAPPPRRVVYYQPEVVEYRYAAPAMVSEGYVGARSSRYCREYTQQVRIGDQVQETYGTACLRPDGTWHIER